MNLIFDILQKINSNLLRLAGWVVVIGMALISIVIPYEVVGRYYSGSAPHWSGELTVFTLVWVSMLGAAVGLPKGYQIGLSFFLDRLPPKGRRGMSVLGNLITLGILSVLFYYGVEQTRININQVSPALQIPMALPYLAIPTGSMVMWLITLEQMLEHLKGSRGEHKQKALE